MLINARGRHVQRVKWNMKLNAEDVCLNTESYVDLLLSDETGVSRKLPLVRQESRLMRGW